MAGPVSVLSPSSWPDRQRALSEKVCADSVGHLILMPVDYVYWTVNEMPGSIGVLLHAAMRDQPGKFVRIRRADIEAPGIEFQVADTSFAGSREGRGRGFALGELAANGAIALLTDEDDVVFPVYNPRLAQ